MTAETFGADDAEPETRLYVVRAGARLLVQNGEVVRARDRISEGAIDPSDVLRIKGVRAVQSYVVDRLHRVYHANDAYVHDKHLGVIVRQMLRKVRVLDAGDTGFLEGELVDRQIFRDENDRMQKRHEVLATAEPVLMGVRKAAQSTGSFVAAASFEKTIRVLTDAAIRGARDDLIGLKENVIIGHLVPAGTGIYRYQDVELEGLEMPAPEDFAPLPGALPNVFSMAEDDEFPASARAGGPK